MPVLPPKKAVAIELLERASLFVHLDPRREGVLVPAKFASQPQLVLQIGLNMAVAIPDLEVNDEGISCTLSFDRRKHFCSMPWPAIYALIGEQGGGMVWPEDVPQEVVAQQRARRPAQPAARKRPHLRAVPGGGGQAPAASEAVPRDAAVRDASARDAAASRGEAAAGAAKRGRAVAEARPLAGEGRAARAGEAGAKEPKADSPAESRASAGAESGQVGREGQGKESSGSEPRSPGGTPRSRPPYLRLVE